MALPTTTTRLHQETERELIPVQRAVKKLAQSGKALESGDLKAVSAALG